MAIVVSIHRPQASLFISVNPNPSNPLKLHHKFNNPHLKFDYSHLKTKLQLRCLSSKSSISNPDPKSPQDEEEELETLGVKAALAILRFYKREISPVLPRSCRYVPTCSEYSMEAYKKYGVLKGTVLTTWRLCRCNPLGGSGFDPPRWFGENKNKPQIEEEEESNNGDQVTKRDL